ncbi:VWA domain-containing protein [Nonomuraea sp. NPDC050663]|uniref:VWA domain-containing protein n=1 Tax=Nonomuraea sp. NPDC050663 TaxID=3364370 RepID=UPI003789655A
MDVAKIDLLPERGVVRRDLLSEVDLVIEVSTELTENRTRTAGSMNLCLVIDRSSSMSGTKLSTAKQSCVDIFRRLDTNDQLTVVTFDHEVSVIVNPETRRDQVESKLRAIQPGGSTNLSLGWYQGLLELQTHMNDSNYSRLFLLSDGQANQGETKRSVFANTATRARDAGITASTIGIGDDFQEDLLEAIAAFSGGRFWSISDSDIEDILEEEFKGALSVVYDRPRIALDLPLGVRVSRDLNELKRTARGYRLRPLQGEDTFNFAVRLEVDPEQLSGDRFTITATLLEGEREVVTTGRELLLGTDGEVATSPVHPLVQSVVQQFETSRTDERVLAELDAGNIAELKQMLTAEIAKLRSAEARVRDMSGVRADVEVRHLLHSTSRKELAWTIMELIEPYKSSPGVSLFVAKLRKSMRHEGHRMAMRRHKVSPWDTDTPIILEAIELAETLMNENPDDAARLHDCREKLRGYLEDS